VKLPHAHLALVEQDKITGYLLNSDHRYGASKARYFTSTGGRRMIKEHDCIVLTQDIPDEGLESGDVGTAVHVHRDGAAYEVEFMTLTGDTVVVATVLPSQLRPVSSKDIAHVRELATH
jgi:hypothetical protein